MKQGDIPSIRNREEYLNWLEEVRGEGLRQATLRDAAHAPLVRKRAARGANAISKGPAQLRMRRDNHPQRRVVRQAFVLRCWSNGMTLRQIADELGFKTTTAVANDLWREQRRQARANEAVEADNKARLEELTMIASGPMSLAALHGMSSRAWEYLFPFSRAPVFDALGWRFPPSRGDGHD